MHKFIPFLLSGFLLINNAMAEEAVVQEKPVVTTDAIISPTSKSDEKIVNAQDSNNLKTTENEIKSNSATNEKKLKENANNKASIGMQADDLLQSMASLVLLMLVLFAASWYIKKNFGMKSQNKNMISLVSVMSLGGKEKIAVINVDSQNIVLGITTHNIRTLHSYPAPLISGETKKDLPSKKVPTPEEAKEFSTIMDENKYGSTTNTEKKI